MSEQPLVRPPLKGSISPIITKILVALFSGIAVFVGAALIIWFGYQLFYSGKIYPGVSIEGIDLSGIRIQEAYSYLAENYSYPKESLIIFKDNDREWEFQPNELGLILDDITSIDVAYSTGRSGWPWKRAADQFIAWKEGINISPSMVYDENIAAIQLAKIAKEIDRPAIEGSIHKEGNEIVSTHGQIGRNLHLDESLTNLKSIFINTEEGAVSLEIVEQVPKILDVSSQTELIKSILSQPLKLTLPDQDNLNMGPWILDENTLANMLSIQRIQIEGNDTFSIGLSENGLRDLLSPLAPSLKVASNNTKFIFNDDTLLLDLIEEADIGRALLIEESIQKINQEIISGTHDVELVFDYSNPEITNDMTGEELGITELVSAQTSYFYGSSASRMQNIETAAAQFHGIMIPPGATFSMVDNLGDISLTSGYAEALIIYGDRTIKGVGGGVCQVSTTLFRTVFFGGFPVVERYSHAYRVSYYELNANGSVNKSLAGLDATVYSPIIDFRFTNDTPYWLLMETYVSIPNRTITWKFYSTSDDRTVEWDSSGLQNIVEPPNPIYEENKDLEEGKIEQVDWATSGADVTVNRTVWLDGEVHISDEFTTHYQPWTTICQYGPDTENYPPAEDKQDKNSCKPLD